MDRLVISMPSSSRIEYTKEFHSLKKFLKESNKTNLAVGFLGGDAYDNGKQVGDVARKNEYGDVGQGQPPRPFMRLAIENIKDNAQDIVGEGILQSMGGDISMVDVLGELGGYSVAEVQAAIRNVTGPPLAERTLEERRKRGNTSVKPLEDTFKMINAVDYKVGK